MKYYEVKFTISAPTTLLCDVRDVVASIAGEAGFESFEEIGDGLKGYVQQSLFSDEALASMLTALPFPDVSVKYEVSEAEDRDWNEQWEQEGFEPIYVDESLVIHDGRHLPHSADSRLAVEIDAQLAFGTGNHQTTRMVAAALLSLPLEGKTILDCGTGTGILAIVALLRGASRAVGYDIDEWSVDNARHNAVLNHVGDRFQSLLGDSAVISGLNATFDVVTANINRNILLHDLPLMRQAMSARGSLLLSGFYCDDIPLLTAKAAELGLELTDTRRENDWACLTFKGVRSYELRVRS